jgi:hypothetical protein
VNVHKDQHGTHISFGAAQKPAAEAAPADTYQGKVNPAEFDNMFAEQ